MPEPLFAPLDGLCTAGSSWVQDCNRCGCSDGVAGVPRCTKRACPEGEVLITDFGIGFEPRVSVSALRYSCELIVTKDL